VISEIPLIILDPVLIKKLPVLIHGRNLYMMLFLVPNLIFYMFYLRPSDREPAIPVLPVKSMIV
jgi:hypothetical protein